MALFSKIRPVRQIRGWLRDAKGAVAIEYAMLAFIAIAIVAVVYRIGVVVAGMLQSAAVAFH